MTCIVGLVDSGTVYIGGDSAGTSDWHLTIRADRKVFRNGDFIMGFTSSFRMGQLLAHSFSPPPRRQGTLTYAYMVTDFIDGVRECLKRGGFAKKDNDQETAGTFLVGYDSRLFEINSDYQVGESVCGYLTAGCGRDIALGSLHSSTGDPSSRVFAALTAAEHFNAGVRGPFHIETLPAVTQIKAVA